jgi:hypothetical protein
MVIGAQIPIGTPAFDPQLLDKLERQEATAQVLKPVLINNIYRAIRYFQPIVAPRPSLDLLVNHLRAHMQASKEIERYPVDESPTTFQTTRVDGLEQVELGNSSGFRQTSWSNNDVSRAKQSRLDGIGLEGSRATGEEAVTASHSYALAVLGGDLEYFILAAVPNDLIDTPPEVLPGSRIERGNAPPELRDRAVFLPRRHDLVGKVADLHSLDYPSTLD